VDVIDLQGYRLVRGLTGFWSGQILALGQVVKEGTPQQGGGWVVGRVSPILEVMPRTLVASPAKEIREWQRQ